MKKLLPIIGLCLIFSTGNAQEKWNGTQATWSYDLNGTRNATLATENETVLYKDEEPGVGKFMPGASGTSNSTTVSPGWFPASVGTTVIQSRASAGNAGSGANGARVKYTLIKDGATFKSLKIDATNALTKLLIRSIDEDVAQPIAKFSFNLKTHYKDGSGDPVVPGAGTAARYYDLVFGHNDNGTALSGQGAWFRGGDALTSSSTIALRESFFTSFRLQVNEDESAVIVSHRKVVTPGGDSGSGFVNGSASFTSVPALPINADGTDYNIEMYCNNSAIVQHYVDNGNIYAVQSQSFHLWANGVKIDEYDIAEPGQSSLSTGKTINAFAVYTTGTASNLTELGYGSIELANLQADYVVSTASTLPVSLTSFIGKYIDNVTELNWTTSSEKNNLHFEVLRSEDGISFEEIKRITGQGNASQINYYSTKDDNPFSGVNYYQLKQVDYNGKYALSDIIAVNTSFVNQQLSVAKNGESLNVSMHSEKAAKVLVSVTDMGGKTIISQYVQVTAGNNQFTLSISALSPSVHVLSVEGTGLAQRVKFVN